MGVGGNLIVDSVLFTQFALLPSVLSASPPLSLSLSLAFSGFSLIWSRAYSLPVPTQKLAERR